MRDRFSAALRVDVLGLELWQWLGLGIGLVVAYFAAILGQALLGRLLSFRKSSLATEGTQSAVRRAAALLAGVVAFMPIVHYLELPRAFDAFIWDVVRAIAVLAGVLLAYSLWDVVCDSAAARAVGVQRAERLLIPILRKAVRSVIVVGGILIGISLFIGAARISGILAGLGIGGLVLALAAKDSVENVFGSLTILFDMPFSLGDWVKIGTVEGVVEEINLRSTRVRTFDDSVITLPNSNLIKASVENFGARRFRRQKFLVRVSYDNSPAQIDAFCDGIRKWLESQPSALPDKTIVELNDFAEPSAGVLVQCFFEAETYGDEMRLRNDLMQEILRLRDTVPVLFAAHPRPLPPSPPA